MWSVNGLGPSPVYATWRSDALRQNTASRNCFWSTKQLWGQKSSHRNRLMNPMNVTWCILAACWWTPFHKKTCCHVDCRILTSSTMSIKTQITGVQICSPSLASIQILPRSSFRASEPAPQTRGQRAAKPDVPRGFCAKLDWSLYPTAIDFKTWAWASIHSRGHQPRLRVNQPNL